VFTAVRFFDNIAYAVTFEKRDPFYVLDLSDPVEPKALGELDISGFSSYLHSINDDNTLILAVGQEADDNGNILGLKITLFDSSEDPSNPVERDTYTVEKDDNAWSSSSVEWDASAFRYLNLGDHGRLIIPMQIYSWNSVDGTDGNFDGFAVFAISDNKISHVFDISHADTLGSGGCYCGGLPERSFVFNGDVMTLKGHSVQSTNLDTGNLAWSLDVAAGDTESCCGYW
jgi:hypothetical protein